MTKTRLKAERRAKSRIKTNRRGMLALQAKTIMEAYKDLR